MIARLIFILFLLFSFRVKAEFVNVRLATDLRVSSFIFSGPAESYNLYGDGGFIEIDNSPGIYQLYVDGDSVVLKSLERNIGRYKNVYFSSNAFDNFFRLKLLEPNKPIKAYQNNLSVKVKNGRLFLINHVDIENYVGGVVESEAGGFASNEYYKLQSILCRTYTLRWLRRHEDDGYNLCDQVHCQAYKKMTTHQNILNAVKAVKGLVIVDSELELITAAYHSNCGGETVNSELVWSLPTSYLKSVRDSFCVRESNATWEKKIPKSEWYNYLSSKYNYPISDEKYRALATNCNSQDTGRCAFFPDSSLAINLKTVRTDLNLKSTYFRVKDQGDYVLFSGRGYGHGIGLCQEGAMAMTKQGYSYKEVIHHYYQDVHIVDLSVLDFFRQE